MTVNALLAWTNFAQVAIPLGIATVAQIKTWITEAHGKQMTDAELNVVLQFVLDDATRRRALAIADAIGHPA